MSGYFENRFVNCASSSYSAKGFRNFDMKKMLCQKPYYVKCRVGINGELIFTFITVTPIIKSYNINVNLPVIIPS